MEAPSAEHSSGRAPTAPQQSACATATSTGAVAGADAGTGVTSGATSAADTRPSDEQIVSHENQIKCASPPIVWAHNGCNCTGTLQLCARCGANADCTSANALCLHGCSLSRVCQVCCIEGSAMNLVQVWGGPLPHLIASAFCAGTSSAPVRCWAISKTSVACAQSTSRVARRLLQK